MMRHGGDTTQLSKLADCAPDDLLDFSVNLNPCGTPEGIFGSCFRSFDAAGAYPEPYSESLCVLASKKWNLSPDNFLFGNGSNQLLSLLPRIFPVSRAIIPVPCYLEYRSACERNGLPVISCSRNDSLWEKQLQPGDLIILGNPNNPDGSTMQVSHLKKLANNNPDSFLIIDEAFADFLPQENSMLSAPLPPNVAVLRSMTKFYAIPGIRIGYCAAGKEWIEKLRAIQPEWMLSAEATACAEYIFRMNESYAEHSRKETARLRDALFDALSNIPGIHPFPSSANFILFQSRDIQEELLKKSRIAVRSCANYEGLDASYTRVAVRSERENLKLIEALSNLFAPGLFSIGKKHKKPALMIQGTASNAGKSILTAAFCRIFLQDGYRIAPFKAQNMALNSFVTASGGEMGRAQAVQAEACRLDPDVRMNPILLKPSSDTGSQVIIRGVPAGTMRVREYYAQKKELWKEVTACYDELSSLYDAVILEGAGSPGEINLKSGDIVNMNMARYAESPVILAGDIDRGGVYASFIGTYATLEPWERKLLYGFLVNKFRGDPSLLAPAHSYVAEMTGKKILGVIDYFRDLGLPEEDSVNFSFIRPTEKLEKTLDVVLIGLGHIANFTDFTPLELEPDVRIRKIQTAEEFGSPDVVILPGSKGVADDMAFLNRSGLAEKIRTAVANGAWYVGICGGLQLAGDFLLDPLHVESEKERTACLGFLPLETIMREKKTLRQTKSEWHGMPIAGYEIHHGETYSKSDGYVSMTAPGSSPLGFEAGRIFTTYLHGIFDNDRFRRSFLNRIRESENWEPLPSVTAHYGTEEALNRLADHVRSRVNMKEIYAKIGLA